MTQRRGQDQKSLMVMSYSSAILDGNLKPCDEFAALSKEDQLAMVENLREIF